LPVDKHPPDYVELIVDADSVLGPLRPVHGPGPVENNLFFAAIRGVRQCRYFGPLGIVSCKFERYVSMKVRRFRSENKQLLVAHARLSMMLLEVA
jgi:hypothetical protein